MTKTRKNMIRQALAILLCAVAVIGVFPVSAFAVENPLALPTSVTLTDMDGLALSSGQEIAPGKSFYIQYYYGTVTNIDSVRKYTLPTLSNQIEVVNALSEEEIIEIPVTDAALTALGTLEVHTRTGEMTFQFDQAFHERTLDDFFLRFAVQLDEDQVHIGDEIVLSFPGEGGTTDFVVSVVDTEKDPPAIKKSGALSEDASESGNVEILWTITVKNGENPQKPIIIQDSWSSQQEYVDGSFRLGGVSVSEGLTLDSNDMGLAYIHTDIAPNSVDVFTYKTRIKSSAFLQNHIPMTSGNILCTNTANVSYPAGSSTPLPNAATASYSHPITWLYKTSGNVLDRTTGEMEWTIIIYNNGLSMRNVVLYDRLSPGVWIMDDTATMQIGNGPVQPLSDFQRTSETDLVYNEISGKEYNLFYPLGDIGNITVIKYHSIIRNMDEYNAGAHPSPDSMYDNRAFITYQLPDGGNLSSIIASPVVEKSGGYDAGLLGKEGKIEPAYHTILWTMTVNDSNEELKGVKVTDKLTYADPISPDENGIYTQPRKYRLCNHVYDDSIGRNKPQYSLDGKNFLDFVPYDEAHPDVAFTYELVPTGTQADAKVYEIVFRLGDIREMVTIRFRSTVTDKIIYANNVTSTNCHYENRAALVTNSNAFSDALADVAYKSDTYQKADARSWYNKTEHSYDFENNRLPWLMRVNINQMEMTNICITDILSEGTSLVEGAMIVGSGTGAWYKLETASSTVEIPKYADGVKKPYYTYNEETRELKIYLKDIVGDEVGTGNATKQIVFYVQVDVDHRIFCDPTYDGYIQNKNGIWAIPNTGLMENDYLSGENAVNERAAYNVNVQHLNKSGTAYKNGEYYSIDYSLAINRIQQTLPDPAVVQDTLPAGLRLDASTLHLYEATAVSPDIFQVNDKGANGKLVKGEEIDPQLYQVTTAVNSDGTTTMRITLPPQSGKKMYVLEYSCDVTDVSKAPFTNSAILVGVEQSSADQTTTRLVLTSAAGGGTLRDVKKTTVTVQKSNVVTGGVVQGAVFGIYRNGLLLEQKTTDENGEIIFENLNENATYTVTELAPAPGYLEPFQVTKTFVATGSDEPVTLAFTNTPIKGTAHFIKTDENGTALPDAEFGIWENIADIGIAAPRWTARSGQNGVVTFTALSAGSTYYIAETAAPENFQKSGEVIVVRMGSDGVMDKLWLERDETETAITAFENSRLPASILVVRKAVTGSVGDREKAFSFTLTVDASAALPVGSALQGVKTAADGTEAAVTLEVGKPYLFTLAHNESLTVNGMTPGTQYAVSEQDYSADGYTTAYVTTKNGVAAQPVSGHGAAGAVASGTTVEAFTNTADIAAPTGVALDLWPYVLILLLAAIGSAILLRHRREQHRANAQTPWNLPM